MTRWADRVRLPQCVGKEKNTFDEIEWLMLFEVIVSILMRKRHRRFQHCCWKLGLSQGIVRILKGLLRLSVKNWDSDQDLLAI